MDPGDFEAECRSLFSVLDKTESGSISLDELADFIKEQRIPLSASQVKELLDKVDKNHDGSISYPELREFLFHREQALQQTFSTWHPMRQVGEILRRLLYMLTWAYMCALQMN